jgi:hypothetical protein
MSYQIVRDGEPLGTFTEEELIEAVENGIVQVTDLAWTEGMEDWESVESLIEIEELEEAPAEDSPQSVVEPAIKPLGPQHVSTHSIAPIQHAPQSPERYGTPPPMLRSAPYPSIPPGHYGPAGSAIASLVLGILSLVLICFTGIPAIICGHIARSKIRRSGNAYSGHGMAVAGLVLGYITTTLGLFVLIAKLLGIALLTLTLSETQRLGEEMKAEQAAQHAKPSP